MRTRASSFILSIACMSILVLYASNVMDEISSKQLTHAKAIVPAKMLAAKFDNALLDARIGFIYFVTIQKPGSLEKGMDRYQAAEDSLAALATLTQQREQLRDLKSPVAQLQMDLDAYHIELVKTLNMVQSGTHTGPVYDAQVKTWASKGGQVVFDANSVEDTCFAISQSSSIAIANDFKTCKARLWQIFGGCSLLSGLLILARSRRSDRTVHKLDLPDSNIVPARV